MVILGGWRSPRVSATWTESLLRPFTSGRREDFLSVAYPWCGSVERAAARALRVIRAKYPGQAEFDLVGVSMGGIVARVLAHGVVRDTGAGLRVQRVFTLATPHRGAKFAEIVRPDGAARQLCAGSTMLRRLDALLPDAPYELVCYALLRDWLVGATRAAPPGRAPLWLDVETTFSWYLSHYAISHDRRVLADVALRLRGETPIGREGGAPPSD